MKLFIRISAVCFGIGLAVMVAFACGMWMEKYDGSSTLILPEKSLNAAAAVSNDSLCAATGPIDENVEGLYTLDPTTGTLQCAVVYVRGNPPGKIGGLFQHNVFSDLKLDRSKQPQFLLITGNAAFTRGGTTSRPAASVCYVIETTSGSFAAYGILWNSSSAMSGNPQNGGFVLLDAGLARPQVVRD